MVFSAGPAIGGELVHDAAIAVFVFDGIFVDAGGEDALLLGVDDDAVAYVLVLAHEHVAVVIDGESVEGGIHLRDETAFAFAGLRVAGLVGEFGVGV